MSRDTPSSSALEIGKWSVPIIARVNRRAKRLILRVDPVANVVTVTAPSARAVPEAIAFAKSRRDWIAGQLSDRFCARPFQPGDIVPFRGEPHLLCHSPGRRATRIAPMNEAVSGAKAFIEVSGAEDHFNRRVCDWMKANAKSTFVEKSDYYCRELNVARGAVTVRDTRTRWGSCSSSGALSFSWRLILAPEWITDYVAAHECTHLIHMDHSPAFWRRLKSLGVDARAANNWLQENGQTLFSYGATSAGASLKRNKGYGAPTSRRSDHRADTDQ